LKVNVFAGTVAQPRGQVAVDFAKKIPGRLGELAHHPHENQQHDHQRQPDGQRSVAPAETALAGERRRLGTGQGMSLLDGGVPQVADDHNPPQIRIPQ
jgi:hypothetical protein